LKMTILFMVLLAFSIAAIATVSIASNVSLRVPTSRVQAVMFDAVSDDVEPNGDPVGGGGGFPA